MPSIDSIKQLRDETGISVGECNKALKESGGDIEKAKVLLKKLGKEMAVKKQEREVGEGLVDAYLHSNGKIGVIVDVRCETDFVARSKEFKELVHEIALQVVSMNPESVEELLEQANIRDSSRTMKQLLEDVIAKLGENIVIKRFSRFEI